MKHHVYDVIKTVLESQKNIHEIATPLPVDLIATGFELEGYRSVIVDQAPLVDNMTVMHAFYQACEFPEQFSFDWDDLFERLAEVASAEDDAGLILLFQDFESLQARDSDTASSLLNMLADVVAIRESQLKVVICSEASGKS